MPRWVLPSMSRRATCSACRASRRNLAALPRCWRCYLGEGSGGEGGGVAAGVPSAASATAGGCPPRAAPLALPVASVPPDALAVPSGPPPPPPPPPPPDGAPPATPPSLALRSRPPPGPDSLRLVPRGWGGSSPAAAAMAPSTRSHLEDCHRRRPPRRPLPLPHATARRGQPPFSAPTGNDGRMAGHPNR